MTPTLSPAQRIAFDRVMGSLETTNVAGVSAVPGFGRTTVLRALHDVLGGTFLGARDFLEASRDVHPLALEEMVHTLVTRALATTDTVIVDDLHILAASTVFHQIYPRGQLMHAVITSHVMTTPIKRIGPGSRLMPGQHSSRCWWFSGNSCRATRAIDRA